jgi:hypothetical protein
MTMLAIVTLLVFALAACGGDDDDDDDADDVTAAAGTTATTSGASTPAGNSATPTEDDAAEATATDAEQDPTATEAAEATATATEEAEPTATEEAAAETPAEGEGEDPLADLQTLDPDQLPNFSMSMTYTATAFPDDSSGELMYQDIAMVGEMRQNSPDNYSLDYLIDDVPFRIFRVDDTTYMDDGTGMQAIPLEPEAMGFGPSTFLQVIPDIEAEIPGIEREGEDEINGRETTRYTVSGDALLEMLRSEDSEAFAGASDFDGEFQIWADNELKIMIKYDGAATWTNADGSAGSMDISYEIFDIGNTARVEAPQ